MKIDLTRNYQEFEKISKIESYFLSFFTFLLKI